MYAPGLTAVLGLDIEQSFSSKNDFRGSQCYNAHGSNDCDVEIGNIIVNYLIARIGSISRTLIMWN